MRLIPPLGVAGKEQANLVFLNFIKSQKKNFKTKKIHKIWRKKNLVFKYGLRNLLIKKKKKRLTFSTIYYFWKHLINLIKIRRKIDILACDRTSIKLKS